MDKIKIRIDKEDIELLEFMPTFYKVAEITNPLLEKMKQGMKTWTSEEIYKKMQVSVWVVNDTRVNAFATYYEGKNYIALTVGLCDVFWNAIEDFVGNKNFSKVFYLTTEKEEDYKKVLYMYMLNFVLAHEFGHIVHGHLWTDSNRKWLEELYVDGKMSSAQDNWISQLREYDADSFAAMINANIMLKYWNENIEVLKSTFDILFIVLYLCFDVFARKTNRDFSQYLEKEWDAYDHPYPGIRMYYSSIVLCNLVLGVKGENETTSEVIYHGFNAIISYERQVLEKEQIKESYFAVAGTEKGVQHIMNLVNGWNEVVDKYNQHSYIQISKTDKVEFMSYFIGENGEFI